MEQEVWGRHPDFTRYEFSNHGNFRNIINGYHYKHSLNDDGYVRVALFNDKKNKKVPVRIHRIVGMLFLEPVEGKHDINHKDGNKTNNYFENLEWVTTQENIQHSIDTGLRKRCWTQKLTDEDARIIRDLYETTKLTTNDLAKQFKVNKITITEVLKYVSFFHVDPNKKFDYKVNNLTTNEILELKKKQEKRIINRNN
jgi:hypothetical protein